MNNIRILKIKQQSPIDLLLARIRIENICKFSCFIYNQQLRR